MAYVTNVTTSADTNAPIGSSLSGTCSTAADVAAKVATVQGFDELTSGVTIHVKFAYGNTASAPTLNVSGTGARYIYAHGTTSPEVSWTAGTVLSLTYIGDAWMLNDAMTEQIRSLQDAISNAKSLLGNLGLDANGNPLVSASAARATLDAAQSESASGSLYDAEQAIIDNTSTINTLRDSLMSWKQGDTFRIDALTVGGFITGSKEVFFMIPLSKPMYGTPSVNFMTLAIRQNGSYPFGFSSNKPTVNYQMILTNSTNWINVRLVFDSAAGINNESVSVFAYGTVTVS